MLSVARVAGASLVVYALLQGQTADTTRPRVTAFSVPPAVSSLTVRIVSFTATDNIGVTGYLITESASAPVASASGWSATPLRSFTTDTAGSKTLYAWAKDAAGNVSLSRSAPVTISNVPAPEPSIFTTQVPSSFDRDRRYELGTRFWADVPGTITRVRLYTHASESGAHVVRIWRVSDRTLVAGPYTWNVTSGTEGWKVFTLPSPVAIQANTDYIVAISNSTDRYYATQANGFTAPINNGNLHTYAGSGLYATTLGTIPTTAWQASSYFRDVVFAPGSVAPDVTAPTITTFTIPAASSSLTVVITSLLATDDMGVAAYLVNESATPPAASATGWSSTPPASYTFGSAGTKTLYAWAKDAAGNVSASKTASVTVTVMGPDVTPPTVLTFAIPVTATSLTVPITSLTATDDTSVTGFLVNESPATPSPSASGWSAAPPASYTFATAGAKTLYAWARDAVGNVSAARTATVTITLADTTPPIVTSFTIPATATSLTVAITSFSATDASGVTGYIATESAAAPAASAAGWSTAPPATYTFASAGSKTLYGWAKDAAGNVSLSRSAAVTITLPTTGPEPSGWFAGDPHVHRSCGGAPESLSSIFTKMSNQNLTFMSVLADMGNGEVQNAVTDLPLVDGQDASISTSTRIAHWDAEWHWDAVYTQYPHQALGGHLIALGVSEAHQIWEEYTYPILNWAHQRGGVAGFAHMQYLDGGIPSSLSCCTPIEYPVEVALGAADFISEDVDSILTGSGGNMHAAINAYYRLLNCGFRPGLAAGTDYPCGNTIIGSLLTYGRPVDGQQTYRGWIDAIARGRTVISRNGHREFLNLVVNGTASPGDEIRLPAAGPVQVSVDWSVTQSMSGVIELLHNGVVIATKSATAAPGTPANLTTTVDFTRSGWLAARRMNGDERYVHTAAVFVIVNGAPIRASAADAQYFVQWIDNLLTNTSNGGPWARYFSTSGTLAQERYRTAKAMFQQIATEAAAGTPTVPSIFTTQVPSSFDSDARYELGTRFWPDVNGQVTQVRLYTAANEGGDHVIRIWRVSDRTMIAGPYTWNIQSGIQGWKTFTLPAPVSLTASTDYIVAISNSTDRIYAAEQGGFAAPIDNGHLHAYIGSGVYSTTLGAMPQSSWSNSNYFRDVVFVPMN